MADLDFDAEKLIRLRGANYTQEQLAKEFDVTQKTISNWLSKLKKEFKDGHIDIKVDLIVE